VTLADAARNNGGVGVCDPPLEVRVRNDHHHRHIAYFVQRLNMRKAPAGGNANMILVERIVPVARERLVTVKEDALLAEAGRLLDGQHINLVVVCDKGGAMAGIVTRRDVVRQISLFLGQGCGCTVPVAMAMTRDVTYCCPDDLLQDVWSIMKERKLLHVPIVTKSLKPLGVINARDLLLELLEESEHEGALLREYVMGLGYH
jgi:CBS domain-containing protein